MTCAVNAPTDHLRQLAHHLVTDVPGADLIAQDYLWRSASEFFRRSARWMVWVDVPAQKTNTLAIDNLEIVKVMQVQYGNDILKERSLVNELDSDQRFINNTPNVLEFTFTPTQPSEAIVAVTLKPDYFQVEQSLLNYYRDAIITGAKSKLFMAQGKEYTNEQLGMIEMQKFDQAITSAWYDAHQFLGYGRAYYGQRQHISQQSDNNHAAHFDPRIDELNEDLKDLRRLIDALITQQNQMNQRINDNTRRLSNLSN